MYHTADEIKEIAKKLKDNGIKLSAVGSPIGKVQIADDFAPHLELFKHTVEAAHILSTKNIRMFSFFIPKGEPAAKYKNEVYSRLDKMLTIAKTGGVKCCHENERDIYGDTAQRCLELLSDFRGRMYGIFDPANYILCGVKPPEVFNKFLDCTEYFHIKDAVAASGKIVPAGKGEGGIEQMLTKFYDKANGTILTVEPHLHVFKGFTELEKNGKLDSYTYRSNAEAFDDAVLHLKELLNKRSLKYE